MGYNVIGICNLHDSPHLDELTERRPIGAVSFLGRYGLIDFPLSNFSNSNIDRMFVLIEYGELSVQSHIRRGQIWIRNTKTGFVSLRRNEKEGLSSKYNTDIQNINSTIPLMDVPHDYVVVAPSFFIASIDYSKVVAEHIEAKRDVTIIYSHRTDAKKEFINCDELKINDKGEVKDVNTFIGKNNVADISLEMFVFTKEAFTKLLDEAKEVSALYNIREMVTYYVKKHKMKIGAYKFNGYVAPILSFEHYVRHSLALLDCNNREKLFKDDWPIYTTTHDTVPAFYGKDAKVKNSFIANGARIYGTVENSIISRNVIVRKDAVIKDSIIWTGTVVEDGVSLSHVISDKGALIVEKKHIAGKENDTAYIKAGAKV